MLHEAKQRYAIRRDAARRHAATTLSAAFGLDFHLSGWTNKAQQAYGLQWGAAERHPDGNWDWFEIFRRYNEIDRMDLVMWGPGERLCGLGLATLRGEHVRFLEGDPRPGCPLRGKRTTVALETAFVYGQACGRREVRIVPVNTELETFYRDNFGFTLETPKGSEAYYRLEIPE